MCDFVLVYLSVCRVYLCVCRVCFGCACLVVADWRHLPPPAPKIPTTTPELVAIITMMVIVMILMITLMTMMMVMSMMMMMVPYLGIDNAGCLFFLGDTEAKKTSERRFVEAL